MAHELRLHEKLSPAHVLAIPIVDQEMRNRVWWTCFLLDASLSAIADRPAFLQVEDVSADLPDDEVWNSLDDFGNPLPGTKAATLSDRLGSEGSIFGGKVVDRFGNPLGDGTATIQQQFLSHGSREYITLMLLFSKVIRYVKKSKAERTQQLKTVDPQLAKLDSQLLDWYARLPESMNLPTGPLLDLVTNEADQRKFVNISFLHLAFQATRILLHRPELTLQNFAWPSGSSFDVCTRASGTMTSILDRILAVDPRMEYINSFSSFCIFESGVIHLVNSIVGDLLTPEQLEVYTSATVTSPSAPTFASAGQDPRRQQQIFLDAAKRSLRTHLAALGGMKRFWATAECFYVTLAKLVVENRILTGEEVYGGEILQRLPSDPQEYFNLLLSEGALAQVSRLICLTQVSLPKLAYFPDQMNEMNSLQQFAR
jgi:hypothetical protein